MHEYDVALKRILTRPGSMLLTALTGSPSLRWLNVEAPLVRNLRVDLLGESPDGSAGALLKRRYGTKAGERVTCSAH